MNSLKRKIENRFLVSYMKKRFDGKNKQASKNLSWIKRQHLTKIVKEHCNVLITNLLEDERNFTFGEKKFIVDKILEYSFDKGTDHLKTGAKINMIGPMLQLNSYIIYQEFLNGVEEKRSKRNIGFKINRELMMVQEEVSQAKSAKNLESVVKEKISS